MYQDTYYIDKTSNTSGDTLAAYGLARLLQVYMGEEVTLTDEGDNYAIHLPSPLTVGLVEGKKFFSLVRFILTVKNASKKPAQTKELDYETEKTRVSEYFELRQNLPPEAQGKGADPNHPALERLRGLTPRPEWPLFQAINQMAAIIGYNDLVNRWEENSANFPDMVKLILFMTSTSPNQLEAAEEQWKAGLKEGLFKGKAAATASQLFNPASGKGQNSAKSSALAMGNLTNFWLLEFLKGVGAFEAAAPRLIKNPNNPRAKDRKLYVLAPQNIGLQTNREVWETFQQAFRSDSSVKMDINAALLYTRTYLNKSEVMAIARADSPFNFEGWGPENYVNGLWSVFYKDLGNSSAVMNISFIGLPNWIPQVETPEEIKQYQDIIEEHEKLLKPLKEERSEEYDLLLTYRNFLSGKDLAALFDFCADYGQYVVRTMEHDWERAGRYLRTPSIENLEVIMTKREPDLEAIVKNEGFKNIAYAIRHSTVIPQRRKSANGERFYEIRYGLGQDLKRKGQYPEQFMSALTDFVQSYNQETEQLYERHKEQKRKKVTIQDLEEITVLIKNNSSELICNMLVAFGYATERRTTASDEQAPPDLQQPEQSNDND